MFSRVATLQSKAVAACTGNWEQNNSVEGDHLKHLQPVSSFFPHEALVDWDKSAAKGYQRNVSWSFACGLYWCLAPSSTSGSRHWLFGLKLHVPWLSCSQVCLCCRNRGLWLILSWCTSLLRGYFCLFGWLNTTLTVQKATTLWVEKCYLTMMGSYVSTNDLANFEKRACGLNNQQEEFTMAWLGMPNFFSLICLFL